MAPSPCPAEVPRSFKWQVRIHREIPLIFFSCDGRGRSFFGGYHKDFLCSKANASLIKMCRITGDFLPIRIKKAIPAPGELMF